MKNTYQLKIEKLAFGGEGIAHHEGKTFFVQGALPGETVTAFETQSKKNFSKARVAEIIQASPKRIIPVCRYAAHCPGCQYQHAAYDEEVRWKEIQVLEILESMAGVSRDRIRPIVPSPKALGYRQSLTLHPVSKTKDRRSVTRLGLVGDDDRTVFPLEHCVLADERLRPVLTRTFSGKVPDRVTFRLSSSSQIVSDGEDTFFRVRLAGQELVCSSRGFFQNNLEVTELLIGRLASWIDAAGSEVLFDLYCGCGTLGLLAGGDRTVFFIEENPANVVALRMNLEERGRSADRIVSGRVEKVLSGALESQTRKVAILVDPPRTGMEDSLVDRLAVEAKAESLFYVSCEPTTLARDLKKLTSGRWEVREAVPFDMFPRTGHVETAVWLKQK